jgi:hypothetical protein
MHAETDCRKRRRADGRICESHRSAGLLTEPGPGGEELPKRYTLLRLGSGWTETTEVLQSTYHIPASVELDANINPAGGGNRPPGAQKT